MATVTPTGIEMGGNPPGTVHYAASDGKFFAVYVDTPMDQEPTVSEIMATIEGNPGLLAVIKRPTQIIETDSEGFMLGNTIETYAEFPVGTTAADALGRMNYTIVAG